MSWDTEAATALFELMEVGDCVCVEVLPEETPSRVRQRLLSLARRIGARRAIFRAPHVRRTDEQVCIERVM